MEDSQKPAGNATQDQDTSKSEKPVDQEAQEQAATERKETGGYQ